MFLCSVEAGDCTCQILDGRISLADVMNVILKARDRHNGLNFIIAREIK